jgi:hypothetical protein
MAKARLARIELPDFGMPAGRPEIPASTYAARVAALRERAADRGYDRLVVYADREHSANLAYLSGFDPRLNAGHQIHLDEWVNSPVAAGSTVELRSGMALQVDIIPATGTEYFTTNIEDGIALADQGLREAFEAAHPAAWARIQARCRFMRDALGIALQPDVLPFSNIPAYLPPFLLRPDHAMTLAS